MARTAIISPNPVSRVWRGRCVRPSRSIRALRVKCHPPRVSSAADCLLSADRCAFVRDGFHVWAALAGPLWLAWHRLWLALIGWIIVVLGMDAGMAALG